MPRNLIVVADFFLEDTNGGSERSLEAILQASPVQIKKHPAAQFFPSQHSKKDFFIVGNFFTMFPRIGEMTAGFDYAIIESDFKFCPYRLPELQRSIEGKCECHKAAMMRPVIDFYKKAKVIFWKSERHLARHLEVLPELRKLNNVVLSITYTPEDLRFLDSLSRSRNTKWGFLRPKKYAVFKSKTWIKGYEDAVAYCKKKKLKIQEISGLENRAFLKKLSECYGLVFLPRGLESCNRMVVEAKILGLDLVINDNVGAAGDKWFDKSRGEMLAAISGRTKQFWDEIGKVVNLEDFTRTA